MAGSKVAGSKAVRRQPSTGFYVRETKPSGANDRVGSSTVRLPDGKVVRQIDRELFDRAVKAAMSHIKK